MDKRKRWNSKLIWEVTGDVKEDGQQAIYRVTEEHIGDAPEVIGLKGLMLAEGMAAFTKKASQHVK